MTAPTSTYAAWRRLSGRPGGTRLFSAAAMARVPHFASVLPHVVRMEPGLAEVRGTERLPVSTEKRTAVCFAEMPWENVLLWWLGLPGS